MNGGVGDHIASLTAVDYIVKQYPWITPLVWVPDFLKEFARHVLPNVYVNDYTSMAKKYDSDKTTKTTEWDGIISPMKIHCLDYAFLKLCDENPSIEHKNYLKINSSKIDVSRFNLPKDYVVITTGFTAEVREFPASEINQVSDYVLSKGLIPVFIGQKNTTTGSSYMIKGTFKPEIDFSKGISLIDQTSLLEAAEIINGSRAAIGVDNGLLHVAGCTNAKIIAGFTTVSPELRLPVRNNVLGYDCYTVLPDEDLSCKFCQVKTNFLYGHSYTKCLYNKPVCVSQMTASKFISNLQKAGF